MLYIFELKHKANESKLMDGPREIFPLLAGRSSLSQREFPLDGLSLSSKKKKNTWEIIFEEETPANHCY